MTLSEEDDEDLRRAIALSLEGHDGTEDGPNGTAASSAPPAKDASADTVLQPVVSSTAIAGWDRRAMEKERLARIAARQQSTSSGIGSHQPMSNGGPVPSTALRCSISPPPRKRQKTDIDRIATTADSAGSAGSAPQKTHDPKTHRTSASTSSAIPNGHGTSWFPHGTIKKTWASGHPRQNDIKIEEVLQKDDLKIAVLSAFQWDYDWIFTKFDTKSTTFHLVLQGKDESIRRQVREDFGNIPNVRLCFPPMPGQVNCMHSKLMLLVYAGHLRVAVPSANLTQYDWGETGVMENSVFIIDLPRLVNDTPQELTSFGQELVFFLEAQSLDKTVVKGLSKFDFSNTKHLAFVHSIGGAHFGETMQRTGCFGLNKAVRELDLETDMSSLNIDFASASIGALTDTYLQTLIQAASGNSVDQIKNTTRLEDQFRVYFPTHETVAKSTGGTDSGGTICLQRQYYYKPAFPKALLRDYQSTRQGLLSHNKILYARGLSAKGASDESQHPVAWAYIGSANLSESAWGKVVQDRESKKSKLNCRNWECGVVIPVLGPLAHRDQLDCSQEGADPAAGVKAKAGIPDMEVFNGKVDLPFQIPAQRYGARTPWFFRR